MSFLFRPFSKRDNPTGPPISYKGAPGSPTLSSSTQASNFDLIDGQPQVIMTRADLRASIAAYKGLLQAGSIYSSALGAMSNATSGLAIALEEAARLKGSRESSTELLASAALHHMISSSSSILRNALHLSFEVPLKAEFESYLKELTERHAQFETLISERTTAIRQTEYENMRQGKRKSRDLNSFRRALEKLQEQVNEVEAIKRVYYSQTLEAEHLIWSGISSKVAFLLKSTLELADRLACKSTDPIVETMLHPFEDPFNAWGAVESGFFPLPMDRSTPSPPPPQKSLSVSDLFGVGEGIGPSKILPLKNLPLSTLDEGISPPSSDSPIINRIKNSELSSNIEALPELSIANLSSISPPSFPLDSTPVIEEPVAVELSEEELEVEIEDPMTGNFQEERFQNMSPTPNGEFSDDEEKEV